MPLRVGGFLAHLVRRFVRDNHCSVPDRAAGGVENIPADACGCVLLRGSQSGQHREYGETETKMYKNTKTAGPVRFHVSSAVELNLDVRRRERKCGIFLPYYRVVDFR